MFPKTSVSHNEQGMPYFAPGYTIRATGDIKEISFETLKEKAAVNEMFMLGVKDIEKYPAMTTFCLYSAWGEVYISILKWRTAPINCCVPAFALAANTSRLEVFALQKNALPAGNARKGALSRQFINMMRSLLSTTPNVMCAAIVTRSAHPMPLKSLSRPQK